MTPSTSPRPSHRPTHATTTPSVTGTRRYIDTLRAGGHTPSGCSSPVWPNLPSSIPCSWLPAVRDLAVQHEHAQPGSTPHSRLPAVRDLAVQHQHAQPDGQGTWWRLRLRSSTGAPRRVRGALRPPEGLRIADAQAPGAGLDPATTAARGAARVGRPGPARPARGGQAASPRTAVSTVFKGLTL